MNVLEICPYEPPICGWVNRVKLLRRVIEARGGRCEILDIGPNRRLERPGCVPVQDGLDYLRKVVAFCRRGFIIHCHVNGEYFRGLLLALAALAMARICGNRCLVTFHAGIDQLYLLGWRGRTTAPFFRTLFALAHAVICNSEAVRERLAALAKPTKIFSIPAFSRQYLDYAPQQLSPGVDAFVRSRWPLVATYLCFRQGFYIEVLIEALVRLKRHWPQLGLVIVGSGDGMEDFRREIEGCGLEHHVMTAGDLGHDAFMSLLASSQAFVRTPTTDGVSSSVLEALSLGVPVIASENGTRPAGVIVYPADDPAALAREVDCLFRDYARIRNALPPLQVPDTAKDEVDLILGETRLRSAGENAAPRLPQKS